MVRLSDLYFGDLEAFDEGSDHPDYFNNTFVVPSSLSQSVLNNKKKYIIVGRKGSGKTAVQFWLSKKLRADGYMTKFFSFYNDIGASEYKDLSKTQKIDFLDIASGKNIFLLYDFREIWARTFLIKIAEELKSQSRESEFTRFCLSERGLLSGIFQGILKSTSVRLTAEMGVIAGELSIDPSRLGKEEISLSDFNKIGVALISKCHAAQKFYLFVDELVFSRLDAKDDEIKARAAMVRDVFRVTRQLNMEFSSKGLDFHIISSLRPEIRAFINENDSEIGKIIDGKDVELDWDVDSGERSLLWDVFRRKVEFSSSTNIKFEEFIDQELKFPSYNKSLVNLIKEYTWGRPRDIVRLLISIAKKRPNSTRIGVEEIRSALDEYSRASMKEIIDEIGVNNSGVIYDQLRQAVRQKEYRDPDEFRDLIGKSCAGVNIESLLRDLYTYGVIGGIDRSTKNPRFYTFHRGDEYLKAGHSVQILPGLWPYFQIT